MAVLQTSDVMFSRVFLLCAGLHFTTGCSEEFPYISCSPGESVLLRCRDENSRHEDVQWRRSDFEASQNSVDVIKDQRYKDRVQIHRNLSLSITRLTVDDSGIYWCSVTESVHLIIEGCSISGSDASVAISRSSGESVFLWCLVTCSARYEPDEFRWRLPNYREINQTTSSSDLNRFYQARFHKFDKHSGNFSLLISNLTEKDEGPYSCGFNEEEHKSFNLTVKDFSRNPLKYFLMCLICPALLFVSGFSCWRFSRAKKGRRGSRVTQRTDHQDDVTQINCGTPAGNQQQDDVIYSSVIHTKGENRTCRKEEVVVSIGGSAQDDVIYASVYRTIPTAGH